MDKYKLLGNLKAKMEKDTSLPLRKGANNLVFADGNPESEIMCIGEGPGFWEDKKGLPFVGNAGAFLNQLLAVAGLERRGVYITNVVHHRPPENRDPMPEEIGAYQPYLDEMINIIDPKVIVTLGRFSMGKFLPGVTITRVHGKVFDVEFKGRKILVVPMYHPAAGLRNPEVKRQSIEDFKKLPGILEEVRNRKDEKKEEVEQMQLV